MKNIKLLKTLEEWKTWVATKDSLPNIKSENTRESNLAGRIRYALTCFKRNRKIYFNELNEYHEIYNKYSDKKRQKNIKDYFVEYKEWIEKNKRFPHQGNEYKEERKLSQRMNRVFKIIFTRRELFEVEVEQLEELYRKFKHPRTNTNYNTFNEWKNWCISNGRTPRALSSDEYESNLSKRMANCLHRMRDNNSKYTKELEEHSQIYSKYFQPIVKYKTKEEIFEEWKIWVKKNNRLPKYTSENDMERKLAAKMNDTERKLYSNLEKYSDILKEYENICRSYNRIKSKTIETVFEEWKLWTMLNGSIPKSNSEDVYERGLSKRMRTRICKAKNDKHSSKIYSDIIQEYEKICFEYKTRERMETACSKS